MRDYRYTDSPKIPDIPFPPPQLGPSASRQKQAGEYAWERTQAHGCEKQEESSETRGGKVDEGLIHPIARDHISDRAELLTAGSEPPPPSEKPHSDPRSSPESKEAEGFSPDRALRQAGCAVHTSQELSTVLREHCFL